MEVTEEEPPQSPSVPLIPRDKKNEAPVAMFLVTQGVMVNKQASTLKDDGCNTNVFSRDFSRRNKHLLSVQIADILIYHSKRNVTETASEVLIGAIFQIGAHLYMSNWAVSDSRYDVLLGINWHE